MNDHDYRFYPWSGFAQINQRIFDWVVQEQVFTFSALNAILSYIRYILAFGIELL